MIYESIITYDETDSSEDVLTDLQQCVSEISAYLKDLEVIRNEAIKRGLIEDDKL